MSMVCRAASNTARAKSDCSVDALSQHTQHRIWHGRSSAGILLPGHVHGKQQRHHKALGEVGQPTRSPPQPLSGLQAYCQHTQRGFSACRMVITNSSSTQDSTAQALHAAVAAAQAAPGCMSHAPPTASRYGHRNTSVARWENTITDPRQCPRASVAHRVRSSRTTGSVRWTCPLTLCNITGPTATSRQRRH